MLAHYILTLSCLDQRGIVHCVSGFLSDHACNILSSAQFSDPQSHQFFMRVHFVVEKPEFSMLILEEAFAPLAQSLNMTWQIHDAHRNRRVILMVSKIGHCLNDLLFRTKTGLLKIDIQAVVSNHADFYQLATNDNIPFYHFPLQAGACPEDKRIQEAHILKIVQLRQVELVILARYMQVLSSEFCATLKHHNIKIVNIHHSFLPSFKGGKPYRQAYDRGVKLIGATAHFVTENLDEGPIIEQDLARVDHSMNTQTLTAIGRDVECIVLARAVKWFTEHRVLENGQRTVIFR